MLYLVAVMVCGRQLSWYRPIVDQSVNSLHCTEPLINKYTTGALYTFLYLYCLTVCRVTCVVCTESSSTQVVDEHFARSLGSEYMRLLKHPAAPSSAPPPSSSLDTTPLNVAVSCPAGHVSVSGKPACDQPSASKNIRRDH